MFSRILLTRMKFIGDVVLTTPIIHTLRDSFPNAHIAYMGDAKAVSLLEHNPYLNEIIPFDFSQKSVLYSLKMFAKLHSGNYDLVIDLFSNPRSALLTFATGAKVRIGGNARGRGKLYTMRIHDDGRPKTAIEYHYQSLKPLNIEPAYFKTEIFLTEREKNEMQKFLSSANIDLSKRIVALHPGGTWPAKLWQKEKFVALTRKLQASGVAVTLTGGLNDWEQVDFVHLNSGAMKTGNLSLRQIAALYSQCKAVVTNDCGVMHIAAAVDTPTIGIFGPGQDAIWFPYSYPHKALRKHVPCNPCHLNICNRTGGDFMECMKLLSVDEVFNILMERI